MGVLQVAFTLLHVQVGLHDIGVRDFATGLLFLCDVEKLLRFVEGLLRVGGVPLRDDETVVGADHRRDQPACCDLPLGLGGRLREHSLAILGALGDREQLAMHCRLAVVDMHAVVRHENAGGRAVSLRVDILIEVIQRGEKSGPCLHDILARACGADHGRLKLRAVSASPRERVLKGEGHRRRGRELSGLLGGTGRLCLGTEDEGTHQR